MPVFLQLAPSQGGVVWLAPRRSFRIGLEVLPCDGAMWVTDPTDSEAPFRYFCDYDAWAPDDR
eukprot:887721-Amphidinium_carterae.1